MRPELEHIEKIERFLEGKMSAEEALEFQKQIDQNESLRLEVELQKDITGRMKVKSFSNLVKQNHASFSKIPGWKHFINTYSWQILTTSIVTTLAITASVHFFSRPPQTPQTNDYETTENTTAESFISVNVEEKNNQLSFDSLQTSETAPNTQPNKKPDYTVLNHASLPSANTYAFDASQGAHIESQQEGVKWHIPKNAFQLEGSPAKNVEMQVQWVDDPKTAWGKHLEKYVENGGLQLELFFTLDFRENNKPVLLTKEIQLELDERMYRDLGLDSLYLNGITKGTLPEWQAQLPILNYKQVTASSTQKQGFHLNLYLDKLALEEHDLPSDTLSILKRCAHGLRFLSQNPDIQIEDLFWYPQNLQSCFDNHEFQGDTYVGKNKSKFDPIRFSRRNKHYMGKPVYTLNDIGYCTHLGPLQFMELALVDLSQAHLMNNPYLDVRIAYNSNSDLLTLQLKDHKKIHSVDMRLIGDYAWKGGWLDHKTGKPGSGGKKSKDFTKSEALYNDYEIALYDAEEKYLEKMYRKKLDWSHKKRFGWYAIAMLIATENELKMNQDEFWKYFNENPGRYAQIHSADLTKLYDADSKWIEKKLQEQSVKIENFNPQTQEKILNDERRKIIPYNKEITTEETIYLIPLSEPGIYGVGRYAQED